MKRPLLPFLFFLIGAMAPCWAGEAVPLSDQEMALHTYGGGELLKTVFQWISLLIYGNSSHGIDQTFHGIVRIALTTGGFSAICLAFLREKFEPLIKNFFLPSLVVMCCLLVPRTTLHIQDHLIQKTPTALTSSLITVKNVPFFLAKTTALISTITHRLTQSLEKMSHGTRGGVYDWTGHIWAGENFFQAQKCRIANPLLENNFREFCRECVFRDLSLGIYSKEDLIHSPDLLEFLENHTSRIRTVLYREPRDSDASSQSTKFLPCREAIQAMHTLLDHATSRPQETGFKKILFGETGTNNMGTDPLGSDLHLLLNQKEGGMSDLRHLIKQQTAIHLLKEEVPGTLHSFASKRAELLQRENQKILGALGANSIVAMRSFFEATIYMVFPLMILFCLFSLGLKPLLNWLQLSLWVNLWPPFYVLLKFLLTTLWELRSQQMFGKHFTLTLFTSEGLTDLYSSMESIAAIAMALIPLLSWILLKGGVSQMVQLTSSFMAPAQTAATTASAEKTYGNYSFGNVNLDNLSGHNAQTFRQTYSGFLSTGSVSLDSGTETTTYTPSSDTVYLKQTDSHLREGISRTEVFNKTLQDSLATSYSALQETSKSYSENLSETTHQAVGLVSALSKQFQSGESFQSQTTSGLQEAVQYIEGIGSDYAKSQGLSYDQALRETLSAGIGLSLGIKGSIEGHYQDGAATSQSYHQAAKAFDSETFQKHLQTLRNVSSSEMANLLKGEDLRLHEDFSEAFQKSQAASEQVRAASTAQEALSQLESFSKSDHLSYHQNLNQRFVDFLFQKYGDVGKIKKLLEMPQESKEKYALIQEFAQSLSPSSPSFSKEAVDKTFQEGSQAVKNINPHAFEKPRSSFLHQGENRVGHAWGEIRAEMEKLKSSADLEAIQHSLQARHSKLNHRYQASQAVSEKALLDPVAVHFWNKAIGPQGLKSVYRQLFGLEDQFSKPPSSSSSESPLTSSENSPLQP